MNRISFTVFALFFGSLAACSAGSGATGCENVTAAERAMGVCAGPCDLKNCAGGEVCDPADGTCRCGDLSGPRCADFEVCDGDAKLCREDRCRNVACFVPGFSCDPADGQCKCGGAGGPTCAAGTMCDSAAKRCMSPSDYIKASNTGNLDQFGASVSLSGDTLAIGAPAEDSATTGINGDQANNGASNSGAVYVFRRVGGSWMQEAYIKASNTGMVDLFGTSVSLSGDTLAVGAPQEASAATGINGDQTNNSAGYSGAVYVFRRSGTTWTQEAYIKGSNTQGGDRFGTSVSLSGDTLAVGAFGESSAATGVNGDETNNGASNAGAVYVFQRTGNTWMQQAYIKASNTDANDQFGESIALSGDTLAVGAQGEASAASGVNGNQTSNTASNSGAVYVFFRTGTSWAQQAYIKASNNRSFQRFGYSVSVSGDTVAVGALQESSAATGVNGNQSDTSAFGSGAVYVFLRTGTSWAQQAYIKASNTEAGDWFGGSVSLSGDGLAVGALSEDSAAIHVNGDQSDNDAPDSGAVYVFRRTGTSWVRESYRKASNTQTNDRFGISVSLSGSELAVAADFEDSAATGIGGNQADNNASDSGAVYFFR